MDKSLRDYLSLVSKFPKLFENPSDNGIIKIILDPLEITNWQESKAEELEKRGLPVIWCKIGILVDDPWFWIIRDLVEFPNKTRNGYIRFVNRKSVAGASNVVLIPMIGDKFILLKHFRHEARSWSWEFPRGFAEPGLSSAENARKELKEELGVNCRSITTIGQIHEPDGDTDYFLAEIDDRTFNLELGEAIVSYEPVEFNELEEWILSGRVADYFSLRAFFFYSAFKGKMLKA